MMNNRYVFRVLIAMILVVLQTNHVKAQDIADIEKAYARYPSAANLLDRSDNTEKITALSVDKQSIAILDKYFSKLGDVDYIKISFDSASDLQAVFDFAQKLPKLKYIQFEEWTFFAKKQDSVKGDIVLPKSFGNCKNIVAIRFNGNSKIDLDANIEAFKRLPNLRFLLFFSVPISFVPIQIRDLPITGLRLELNKNRFPDWVSQMKQLKNLEIVGDVSDCDEMYANLSNMPSLDLLWLRYTKISTTTSRTTKLNNVSTVKVESATVENAFAFFQMFDKNKKLRELSINSSRLNEIPKNIQTFQYLNRLTISSLRNHIQIPEVIGRLSQLEYLDISHDSLVLLPRQLYTLKKLKVLNVSQNKLANLADEIGTLNSLKDINYSYNNIVELPASLNNLLKLETMDGSVNPIKRLPSLSNLKFLQKLKFDYCDLQSLPNDIGSLRNMQELHLKNNFLQKLPDGICELNKLKYLNIEHNNLQSLPEEIGNLRALEELNLEYNQIEAIPSNVGRLSSLRELFIGYNKIKHLPKEIAHLSSLEKFFAYSSTAQNKESPRNYYSSRVIYRGDKSIPDTIPSFSKLKDFPNNLEKWKKIKEIRLDGNDFSQEPNIINALATIPAKGYKVNLNECGIQYLPDSVWKTFYGASLELADNKIKKLPPGMVNAPYLSYLTLSRNGLPTTTSNLNTFSENRYGVLLYFQEAGLLSLDKLPKNDMMVLALLQKGNQYFLWQKNYAKCVEMVRKAESINPELTAQRMDYQSVGESQYHIGEYKGAIEKLTKAIQEDTSGFVRIFNSIYPDFIYRAKSYLAIRDTLNAIKDYETLAGRFDPNLWSDAGILYKKIGDDVNAKRIFMNGAQELDGIRSINPKNHQGELIPINQLSVLELYIVAEDFAKASVYADSIQHNMTDTSLKPICQYLVECLKIISTNDTNYKTDFNPNSYKGEISKRWSFGLFLQWLDLTKINRQKVKELRALTLSMQVAQQ